MQSENRLLRLSLRFLAAVLGLGAFGGMDLARDAFDSAILMTVPGGPGCQRYMTWKWKGQMKKTRFGFHGIRAGTFGPE